MTVLAGRICLVIIGGGICLVTTGGGNLSSGCIGMGNLSSDCIGGGNSSGDYFEGVHRIYPMKSDISFEFMNEFICVLWILYTLKKVLLFR